MNINFYIKSMKSFIILSLMWYKRLTLSKKKKKRYKRLTKCYLLHTDPLEFRELEKTCQATWFPLSTLNHWRFTEHTSWSSKPWLLKFPRWAKNEMMCYELEPWTLTPFLCKYGLFWTLKEIFSKSMITLM